MSGEQVIELGSSEDEEQEPPPPKKSKPPPNAMVHIPKKIHGVTIKPASINRPKVIINTPKNTVTIAKKNTIATAKTFPVPTAKNFTIPTLKRNLNLPIARTANRATIKPVPNIVANPFSIKATNGKNHAALVMNKTPNIPIKNAVNFIQINNVASLQKKAPIIKRQILPDVQVPKNNKIKIPPGITVTKTSKLNPAKRMASQAMPSMPFKKIKLVKQNVAEVVNLDDETPAPVTAGSSGSPPKWYMRPEDHPPDPDKSMEIDNNKEPSTNMIEITIEDSPVKPPNKRTKDIGAELAITIDDSPSKTPHKAKSKDQDASASGSEDEGQKPKTPQSRKKLQYPNEVETQNVEEQDDGIASKEGEATDNSAICEIEIEIEPIQPSKSSKNDKDSNDNDAPTKESGFVIEIPESPKRKVKTPQMVTPRKNVHEEKSVQPTESFKKREKDIVIEITESPIRKENENPQNVTPKKSSPEDKATMKSKEKETSQNDSQIHPVYQSLIDLCFELEDSEDMHKIVNKKIKAYYLQVPKEFRESDEFIEMVSSKVDAMKASPERMYLYIKDIVDELNMERKKSKAQLLRKEKEEVSIIPEEPVIDDGSEASEKELKRRRHVRKLEKTLKKLHRAVQKLEEQEVDFDDDGDSVYLLTERYKERLVRVHAKLCQLSNTKMPSEPRVHLEPRPGRPSGPARRLEKWINRRVPLGTPLPFPDFHDVLECVRAAVGEERLPWSEADILEEARDLFTRCGKKLQRRRQENEWRLAASRIAAAEADPADISTDLKKKLEENRRMASQKEYDLINKFADKQNQMKLVAVEIGDKEADESPVESGDEGQEEANDEGDSLENKQERKDRIKRLLKEKTRHDSEKSRGKDDDSGKDKGSDSDHQVVGDKEESSKTKDDEKEVNVDNKKSESPKKDPLEAAEGGKDGDAVADKADELEDADDVQVLSDDSKRVDSDVDELHLLEKLHTASEGHSTIESSDSESPIAISDTLGSSDDVDNKAKQNADEVVSIENSTDSEREVEETMEIDESNSGNKDDSSNVKKQDALDKPVEEMECEVQETDELEEVDCNEGPSQKNDSIHHDSNDECSGPVEDILLASTDEESNGMTEISKVTEINSQSECVNLKDDALSIGETVIEGLDGTQITENNKIEEIDKRQSGNHDKTDDNNDRMKVDNAGDNFEKTLDSEIKEHENTKPKEDAVTLVENPTLVEDFVVLATLDEENTKVLKNADGSKEIDKQLEKEQNEKVVQETDNDRTEVNVAKYALEADTESKLDDNLKESETAIELKDIPESPAKIPTSSKNADDVTSEASK